VSREVTVSPVARAAAEPAIIADAAGSVDDQERTLAGRWALLVGAGALLVAAVYFLSAQWEVLTALQGGPPLTAPASLLLLAVGCGLAWLLRGRLAPLAPEGTAETFACFVAGFATLAAAVEAYNVVLALPATGPRDAFVAVSVAWFAVGAAIVLVGLRLSSRPLRQGGLGVLALTGCKVLLLDTAQLGTMGRVAAFTLIGVVFIGVALLYGRQQMGRDSRTGGPPA
jgi:hypothetical protein